MRERQATSGMNVRSRTLQRTNSSSWWSKSAYGAADNVGGAVKQPAAIFNFNREKYALTKASAAEIALNNPLNQYMNLVRFSDAFTFTRASTATYLDANGATQVAAVNAPRFDYTNGKRQLPPEALKRRQHLNLPRALYRHTMSAL